MRSRFSGWGLIVVFIMLGGMLLAACGSDDDASPPTATSQSGSGSSSEAHTPTAEPAMEATEVVVETGSAAGPLILGVTGGSHFETLNWPLRRQPSYPFLDEFRTMCVAPPVEVQALFASIGEKSSVQMVPAKATPAK